MIKLTYAKIPNQRTWRKAQAAGEGTKLKAWLRTSSILHNQMCAHIHPKGTSLFEEDIVVPSSFM